MKTAEIKDLTDAELSSASQRVISGIKAYDQRLDTRRGTVLRDLLVDPEAVLDGVTTKQIEYVRTSTSLKRMDEDGEVPDVDDVSAILSNFNLEVPGGKKATGLLKISVSDASSVHTVQEGAVFRTADGKEFESPEQVVAAPEGYSGTGLSVNARLYKGASGGFFLVPVVAREPGAAGNIEQGTAVFPESGMFSLVSSEAYKSFDGGSDVPTMSQTMAAIPSGLSIRGFVSSRAIEGMLRSRFDRGDFPIVAVSSVGYGNGAQRRDKHNVFGVGVGGRIDVYVRNFGDLFTVTKIVTGRLVSDGEYSLRLGASDFPAGCWIKSISDAMAGGIQEGPEDDGGSGGGESVVGSLRFTAERVAEGVDGTWHDIDVSRDSSEIFNTIWQGFSVSLHEVPPVEESGSDSSGGSEYPESRDFKVTVYCLPQARELQEYVDSDTVRSVSTDVIVRCPIVCSVYVNAIVRYDPYNPIDETRAASKIRSYINGLGFVGRLSRSEIVHILKNEGAVSVDMSVNNMLSGTFHDAFGAEHVLAGDSLDIRSAADDRAMVATGTVVFAAEQSNIHIKTIPNT